MHSVIDMPDLLVRGTIVNNQMKPISNSEITIVNMDFYGVQEGVDALRDGMLDTEALQYTYTTIKTDAQGRFETKLPGESRYIGYMYPFTISEKTMKTLFIGAGGEDFPPCIIEVSGTIANLRVPGQDKKILVKPPRAFPVSISTTAERTEKADVVTLTVQIKNK